VAADPCLSCGLSWEVEPGADCRDTDLHQPVADRRMRAQAPLPPLQSVWVAYYSDGSGHALFQQELQALRHAVDRSMSVAEVRLPCEDLGQVLRERGKLREMASMQRPT
jgi:hypothetical protein